MKRFIDERGKDYSDYLSFDAGIVGITNNEFCVCYQMSGAEETFSVGQPVYDDHGNMLGYLGVGLYSHLDYSPEGLDVRVPVEYWKICHPTVFCVKARKVYTYWQNKERRKNDGK